jgi:hypothetical protein
MCLQSLKVKEAFKEIQKEQIRNLEDEILPILIEEEKRCEKH